MIYIVRNRPSDGARSLAAALECRRVRGFKKIKLTRNDKVVSWGEELSGLPCQVLNGAPLRSKYTDAVLLGKAGVPTIEVSKARKDGWLGRDNDHTGGLDLLDPTRNPDYYVKRENLVREYRVHSFMGRSIRAGIKKHREGFAKPHEWIRSWDGGWKISYDGESVKQRHRDVAHQALKALGLDFGAVDIGEKKDKSVVVLEVNRAPGLEGGTIEAYARAIREWAK